MAFLLDLNVLIARIDPRHEHHLRAWQWLDARTGVDLVTCPLTENGFVRIFGHPSYPKGPGSPEAALEELRVIRGMSCHRFIGDTVSIDDPTVFHSLAGIGPKQVTDIYLLGLAAKNRIFFATFDSGIPSERVVGGAGSLVLIP
jgi:toxin-antitoxin system PIN domain toxin